MELSQLYQDTRDVGKRIKGTKRYHLWEFVLNAKFHKIEMFHSHLSGKKKLCLDSQVLVDDKSYQNNFNYSFRIQSYNISLTQVTSDLFELRINNRPFEMLIFEERNGKNANHNRKYNYNKEEENRGRELNIKENIMKGQGDAIKSKKNKKAFDFLKGHNGFSNELNENEDEEFDFDYNDHDDFNIDNCHDKYQFSQTEDVNDNDINNYENHHTEENKRDLNKRFSFEGRRSKGFKKIGSSNQLKEERSKSKFIPSSMINDPFIHNDNDNNNQNKQISNDTFEYNRNIFNTITQQNNLSAPSTIIPTSVSNNIMESFISNNDSTCSQILNIIPQEMINANNTLLQKPLNNNNNDYHLINQPFQYNQIPSYLNSSYENYCQPQNSSNQYNYSSQESINYPQMPSKMINSNPIIQSNTRYQMKEIPASLSFETNSLSNTTNQSDQLSQSDQLYNQQQLKNVFKNSIASNGLVDISNLFGNNQQEIVKNNNFVFQFRTPNGFQ